MNVLVLTTMIPFERGRAEELTDQLVRHMKLSGVNAEAMRLPFKGSPPERLLDEMFIFKSLQLFNVDRVISLAFPAYLVPFDNRATWLPGSYAQSRDHFLEIERLGNREESRFRSIKEAVLRNDIRSFQTAKQVFAGSKAVQSQLQHHCGIVPDILLPPLSDPERFRCLGDDGYILVSGRVDEARQLAPLIDAMKLLPPEAKLVFAGVPDNPLEARRLQDQVRQAALEGRITFDLRDLSRDDLAALVGRARALAWIVEGDDPAASLVMEACEASKPVLTSAKNGDLFDIVLHGETGIVSEPTAEALAEGIAILLGSSRQAAELGAAGHDKWRSLKVDWSTTIERLLA